MYVLDSRKNSLHVPVAQTGHVGDVVGVSFRVAAGSQRHNCGRGWGCHDNPDLGRASDFEWLTRERGGLGRHRPAGKSRHTQATQDFPPNYREDKEFRLSSLFLP